MEEDPFPGHAVEMGRLHPIGAISPGMAMGPIVGNDEEQVGPARRLSRKSGRSEEELTTIHSVQVNVE